MNSIPVSRFSAGISPECRFAKLTLRHLQGNIQNIELFRLVRKKLKVFLLRVKRKRVSGQILRPAASHTS
jgi:hypothetical protein